MNVQTLLVAYAQRKINSVIVSLPTSELLRVSWKFKQQINLNEMAKNKTAIPHIEEMKKIKTLIWEEINRRNDAGTTSDIQ